MALTLPEYKTTNAWSETSCHVTLTSLAKILRVAPPRLSSLMGLLNGSEGREDFMNLVAEYLPDHLGTLMRLSPFEAVSLFVEIFSDAYFPIDEVYAEEGYLDLLSYIPLIRVGIGWDDYHQFDDQYRTGINLMLAFIASPYAEWDNNAGPRVPILETAAGMIGDSLARRIPENGLNPHELHQVLDRTPYEGVALLADILYQDTDNIFLDINYQMEIDDAEWSRALVDELTPQWPEAERVWGVINRLAERMERGFEAEAQELLAILEAREQEDQGPAPNTPLMEVFAGEDYEAEVLRRLDRRE